jgi:hypothetical protein
MAEFKLTRPNSYTSDTEEAYYRKRGSFSTGFTLTQQREILLWSTSSGGDGNYYQWMGSLPKVVPKNSVPNDTGGVSSIAWINRGNGSYLDAISSDYKNLDNRVLSLEKSPGGKSAYEIYVDTTTDSPVKTEQQWLDSLKGTTGSGLNIRGSFASTDNLPKTNNKPGDAYIIQEQMWVWDSTQWSVVGEQGPEGKSTYQIWLAAGNQGTQTDFLIAQKGVKGDPGPQGSTGPQGANAVALDFRGTLADVNSLPQSGQDNLNWLYVINLEAFVSNGASWVNLGKIQGPQGTKGDPGADGVDGKDGLDGKDGRDGIDGPQGIQGVPGKDGAGIEILDHLDTQSDLPTTASAGDAYLVGADNELFIWLTDATSFTNVGKIAGEDGVDGKDGIGIASTDVTYQLSLDPTTPPTGVWSSTVPILAQGQYLWTRVLYTLTDSTTVTSYSVSYQGLDGAKGTDGVNGRDGTDGTNGTDGTDGADGHSVLAKGYLTDVANLPTTGNNVADMYYVNGETYIWDGNSWVNMGTNIGPVGPAGPDGQDGAQGIQGEQGTLWINLSGPPNAVTGRQGDFYIDRDTNIYYQKTSDTQWSQLGTFGGGNVYDAPSDGTPYVRQDGAWSSLAVREAPNDGSQYARKNGGWAVVAAGISDAPNDGTFYARNSGAWVTFTPIDEAPAVAGQQYVRSNGAWRRLNRYDLSIVATTATLDVSSNQTFTVDLSTARTLSITNLPTGRSMPIVITFTGNSGAVSWTNTVNWSGGIAPVFATTETTVILYWTGAHLNGFTPAGY